MSAEGIVRHQLLGHLSRQARLQTAAHVDLRQLLALEMRVGLELGPLPVEIGLFNIGLGADRNVFPGSHRHGARDQTGHTGDQHVTAGRLRRRDPDDEARG